MLLVVRCYIWVDLQLIGVEASIKRPLKGLLLGARRDCFDQEVVVPRRTCGQISGVVGWIHISFVFQVRVAIMYSSSNGRVQDKSGQQCNNVYQGWCMTLRYLHARR
jgi:hypothetical protein